MATDYNSHKVHLVGIASDLEFKYTQNGVAVLNFWLSVPQFTTNPKTKQEKEYQTEFFCTVWRGVAEDLNKALPDGKGWVAVHSIAKGGIRAAQPWHDDQSGEMVSCIELSPDRVTLAGPDLDDGRSGVLDIEVTGKVLYPELRQTSSGFNVWSGVLYVNERKYTSKTDFTEYATKWKLTAWRDMAQRLDASVGDREFIEVSRIAPGGIQASKPWQDNQGTWQANLELTIRDIVYAGGSYGADEDSVEETPQQQSGPPRRRTGGGNGGGQSQPAAPPRRRPSVVTEEPF